MKKTRELQGNSDIKMQEDNLELLTIYVEYLENSRLHEVMQTAHLFADSETQYPLLMIVHCVPINNPYLNITIAGAGQETFWKGRTFSRRKRQNRGIETTTRTQNTNII